MVVTNTFRWKIWTYEQIKADKAKFDEVFAYIKMYGSHSMAYSILQPRMNYFILDGVGIVAYGKLGKNGKTRYVLGDPLVSCQYAEYLLGEFLKVFPNSCFLQVSESIARILNINHKYFTNVFGRETIIERKAIPLIFPEIVEKTPEYIRLSNELAILEKEKDELYKRIDDEEKRKRFWQIKRKVHNFRDKLSEIKRDYTKKYKKSYVEIFLEHDSRKALRRDFNTAKNYGLKVREVSEWEIYGQTLQDISDEWIKFNTVTKSEMSFLTMPFNQNDLFSKNKRIFIVEDTKGILGFLEIVPIFLNDNVIGYYADIIRTIKEVPSQTTNYMLLMVMNQLFDEGYELFSLGLSPFNKVEKVYLNKASVYETSDAITTKIFQIVFDYGNFLYNAKGQAFHKGRYNVKMQKVFYCTKQTFPMMEILGGFKICGINIVQSAINSIVT